MPIWPVMGYSKKTNAKAFFEKCKFTRDVHYIIVMLSPKYNSEQVGGAPVQGIFMTPKTFKKFCLKSGKAEWVHDYFLAM